MEDKKLLEGIISEYYDSVKDSFLYRVRNGWKISTSDFYFVISIIFLVTNIIPIFPSFQDNYLVWIFHFIEANYPLGVDGYPFWMKWVLGVIVSFLNFGIAYIIFKYWNKRGKKKAISKSNMSFCYAFATRKEIKSYLINGNFSHLENISQYFQKVNSRLIQTPFYPNAQGGAEHLTIYELRDVLLKSHNWVVLNKESNDLIDALESIGNKIEKRINQKEELEKVLPFIEILTLYEFTYIKPNYKNSQDIELKDQRFNYLKEIAKELDSLNEFEGTAEVEITKKSKIKSTFNFIFALFTNSNIIVMFICWFVLLAFVFMGLSFQVINKLNLVVDSTILIGLLTAPFLGAITLTATIYAKNKD